MIGGNTRVGDMPRNCHHILGLTPDRLRETLAFADIVSGVGPCESDYKTLYQDYEHASSLEARLVKAADVIGPLSGGVCARTRRGKRARRILASCTDADFSLPTAAREVVRELLTSLLELHRATSNSEELKRAAC